MKTELFGVEVDKLTLVQCADKIADYIGKGIPRFVITLNPEIICRAINEPDIFKLIKKADLITADGVGIVWASNVKKDPVPERVTGIDLMQILLKKASEKGWRIFFLGSAPGVALEASQKIKNQYPQIKIVGTQHGYFKSEEEKDILKEIKNLSPDLLFVALGAPRQEQWIYEHKDYLGVPISIGVGGSLDVLSGNVKRAPKWIQKLGLEWLSRFICQPSRLKRSLCLPKFVWLVLKKYKFSQH